MLVVFLFYGLRRLEVWLHQHIFKVGWLVTNQYQTTTILYYAFFLPGILLNQLTIWLVAGFLNVRAARSIAWPQKQEIGQLKLNFVQLSKNVDTFRLAIISTAPLLIGLISVYYIANNILGVPTFLATVEGGGDFGNAVGKLTTAPDFWLWVYIAFTISNTMMPNFQNLRGWRIIIGFIVIAIIVLYAVGAGSQVVTNNLSAPVISAVNSLSGVFAIIIGLDIFMVAVLGTIEAIVERVTGDSATFEKGKMITMRRSEMLAQRAKALAAPAPKAVKASAVPSGPPSVYKLQFPIPGAPGKETVTRDEGIVITADPNLSLPASSQPAARSTPSVIPGAVTDKPSDSAESKPTISPTLPGAAPRPPALPSSTSDEPPKPSTPTSPPSSGAPKPATPGASPSPFSPGGGTPRPATPAGSSTSPRPSAPGSSPLSPAGGAPRPATPIGSSTTPRPATPGSPSPSSPGGDAPRPATPVGSSTTPRPTTPGSSSPFASPRPAGSPFSASPARPGTSASKPSLEDDEDIDDEELEDDEPEDSEDDVSYEDFEDPA